MLGGVAVGIVRADADDGIGRHDGPKENVGAAGVAAMMIDPQYIGGKISAGIYQIVFGIPFRVAAE